MTYTQGFVVPVPKAKKKAYIELARKSGKLFHEYGALHIVENWAEDLPAGKVTDFNRAVKLKDGEAVAGSPSHRWVPAARCSRSAPARLR